MGCFVMFVKNQQPMVCCHCSALGACRGNCKHHTCATFELSPRFLLYAMFYEGLNNKSRALNDDHSIQQLGSEFSWKKHLLINFFKALHVYSRHKIIFSLETTCHVGVESRTSYRCWA